MLLSMREENKGIIWQNINILTENYPEFTSCDDKEKSTLLKFRNIMAVAIQVLPPKSKKAHLLDLVTRIVEGSQVRYITGSGETLATRRRVLIYEREGNIVPRKRPNRKPIGSNTNSPIFNINPLESIITNEIIKYPMDLKNNFNYLNSLNNMNAINSFNAINNIKSTNAKGINNIINNSPSLEKKHKLDESMETTKKTKYIDQDDTLLAEMLLSFKREQPATIKVE